MRTTKLGARWTDEIDRCDCGTTENQSALALRLVSPEAFLNNLVDGIEAAIYATRWRSPAPEWEHVSGRIPTWVDEEALSAVQYLRFVARCGQ
jgi:hypothetical protein